MLNLLVILSKCVTCVILQGPASETPAVEAQEEGRDRTRALEAPSAKRLKSQFRCSKCGFITDDRTQFQQHIPQHKTDENTPQCLHCGLCFTSVLSLNRHLFIVHKVKEEEREEEEEEERSTDCNLKLSTHSQTQAVSLR